MLQALGKNLFRLWLALLGSVLFALECAQVGLAKLLGQEKGAFRDAVADGLLAQGRVVFPALLALSHDNYEHLADGPGWAEKDIPRLWATCRELAATMKCPPPDAIHLSLAAGDCCAWTSRDGDSPGRRHIALSLLDLRLVSADEARAIIAHEIAHVGFNHSQREAEIEKVKLLMAAVRERVWFPFSFPVTVASVIFSAGAWAGKHDLEREADKKASEAVGGNHAAWALRRTLVASPILDRIFQLVLQRAEQSGVAPLHLAEAVMIVYRANDFAKLRLVAREMADVPGESHPALVDRVAAAERMPSKPGVEGSAGFLEAYPELLACEEQLSRTYFPDAPVHTRSDASTLKRRALAARMKAR